MCAYNRVNGQPACASDILLKERLRGAWKFNGYVVSDCDAVADINKNHKYAPDQPAAVAAALKMGVDNECHTGTLRSEKDLGNRYKEAYEQGLIGMAGHRSRADPSVLRTLSKRGPAVVHRRRSAGEAAGESHESRARRTRAEDGGTKSRAAQERRCASVARREAHRGRRPACRLHARAAWELLVFAIESARYRSWTGCGASCRNATVTHVPWSPSVTDGDPVPTSALRADRMESRGCASKSQAMRRAGSRGRVP